MENLNCDCAFITHHTISSANLTGPDFLGRKEKIAAPRKEDRSPAAEGFLRFSLNTLG